MATQEQLGLVETAYHRLYRAAPGYRWWKPLIAVALVGLFILIATGTVAVFAVTAVTIAQGGVVDVAEMEAMFLPDTQQPLTLLLALGSTALWLPCVAFALWTVGIRPMGRLSSVALRLRWGLLLRCVLPAIGALVGVQALSMAYELLVPGALGGQAAAPVPVELGPALISLVLILVLVPLQAAAEEVVFRGVLMQALGSWFRSPLLPILIPTVIFASLHIYDPWGLAQVALMGLTAGWLTWRTGGLEAAIVIHVINNVTVFALMTTGLTGETGMTEAGGNLLSLIVSAAMFAIYAWFVVRIMDRGPWQRTMRATPEPPMPQPLAVTPLSPAGDSAAIEEQR